MSSIQRVGIVGNGHVANVLGPLWLKEGIEFVACSVRQNTLPAWLESASTSPAVQLVNGPENMLTNLDAFLLAVSDDAIESVAHSLPKGPLVIHFSGTISTLDRPGGVIWPVQSLHRDRDSAPTELTCLVEPHDMDPEVLLSFARHIATHLHLASAGSRQKAHLAAVFAANFSNHALAVAQELIEQTKVPWDTFAPLIQGILQEGLNGHSASKQTGPAIRRDSSVIRAHRATLQGRDQWLELYDAMTASIQSMPPQTSSDDTA